MDKVSLHSIEEAAQLFSDTLHNTAKTFMPVKTVSVRQCDKPWISEKIKQIIRNKNKLQKKAKIFNTDQSWKSIRQIRNDPTYAIRKRKLDYLQDLDNRASSSATFGTKNWWKLVKFIHEQQGI